MAGQTGFFELDERYRALSAAGDPLQRLAKVVDFELFRGELEMALRRSDRSKGGRPPYDAVLMFRVLVLQTLYLDRPGHGFPPRAGRQKFLASISRSVAASSICFANSFFSFRFSSSRAFRRRA